MGSAADAVQGAQIVTTCTADKRRAVVLSANSLGHGVHVNAIGGDCPGKTELNPRILDVSSVFVEHTPQTRIEGEIQNRPADFPVTELCEVIEGGAPGRTDAHQITVFDSVGFAIEDFTTLTLVERETRGRASPANSVSSRSRTTRAISSASWGPRFRSSEAGCGGCRRR